jgi:hypothetical protein
LGRDCAYRSKSYWWWFPIYAQPCSMKLRS